MKQKTLLLTRTSVMLALLIVLQFITKPLGQLVTGSAVNLILAIAVLVGGFWCGMGVALLSPIFAFLLGIGPALIQIVPAICLGNLVFIAVIRCFPRGIFGLRETLSAYIGVIAAALAKFALLFVLAAQLIIPSLGLPAQKAAVMSAMFSWPQLFTALIGGLLALTIHRLLTPSN
ncbi:MAG: hypothetical protein RR314_08050, partial [Oscillospiraceae bacterium]